MNIGIDATCWWNNRGFGRFTREMLTAMFRLESDHRFYLFVDQPLSELSQFENVQVIEARSSRPTTEAAVADGSRSPVSMYKLCRAVASCPLDIMFFPAVYSWFPVPLRIPAMVTLHDAIAERYPKLIFPNWRGRLFWAIKMKSAVWTSRRILTVSRAAKAEIIQYIGVSSEKIDITTEAPSPAFQQVDDDARKRDVRQRYKLPLDAPIIVFVGGLAPHKNLHGLLDGYEKSLSSSRVKDVSLVLVGDFKGAGFYSNYDSLYKRVHSNPELCKRVHFTGYVPEEDLVSLYNTALAVAMPSYSEGFGLPAVEAMACSAPVLSSDRGSLPEVVGEAGIYFDPFDVTDISRAINEMVANDALRQQLSRNALAIARGFTWQKAAELTLTHLEGMRRRC